MIIIMIVMVDGGECRVWLKKKFNVIQFLQVFNTNLFRRVSIGPLFPLTYCFNIRKHKTTYFSSRIFGSF